MGLINSLMARMGRKRRTRPAAAVDVVENLDAADAREAATGRDRWIAEAARSSKMILELRTALASAEATVARLLDSCAARDLTICGVRAELEDARKALDIAVGRSNRDARALTAAVQTKDWLGGEVERLRAENAKLDRRIDALRERSCDDGCQVARALDEFARPVLVGSWSGLREGG